MPNEFHPLTVRFPTDQPYVTILGFDYFVEWADSRAPHQTTLYADVTAPPGTIPNAVPLYKDPKHHRYAGVGRRDTT